MLSRSLAFIAILAAVFGHSNSAIAANKKSGVIDIIAGNLATKWVNEPKPGSLPPGMTHHIYFSKSMGHDVGYCIYLPPEYESDTKRRYPVIYTLHGAGGNELHG